MIQIKTGGESLDLPAGFSIEIEDTNPIFNERGSQSIPATIPATRRNIALLDAPHRIDSGTDPNDPGREADVVDGAYIRRGTMNITEAGKSEGITFNVGFDNSTAYVKWTQRKLSELTCLPTYRPKEQIDGSSIDWLLNDLYRIYMSPDSRSDDFAVFPLAINKEDTNSDSDKQTYWEVLNIPGNRGLVQPTAIKRLIDGTLTEVKVPEGYCVSPFLRVWRVLELIFTELDLEIVANPFKTDIELSRLVVLNNAADSCCKAYIRYADLMPDCTVEEFMNALWVRFGLVYNIDNNTATVSLRFLKDIVRQSSYQALEKLASGYEKITYNARQYVKLSASTSIDGAAPSNERFEDFSKGLDVSKVRLGVDVSKWQMSGTQEDPRWDGDVSDQWDNDPDNPDPEYPDPEQPDPDPDDGGSESGKR